MDLMGLFNIINPYWVLLLLLPFVGYICWRNPYEYNSFAECVASIGGNQATIMIPNEQLITDNLIIPANITLEFIHGGSFNISAGKTVTINGTVEAGLYQIFEGTGTVVFGSSSTIEVYPHWWGFSPSASAAVNESALQAAITASHNLTITDGDYSIAGGLTVDHKMKITLKSGAILRHTGAGDHFIRVTYVDGGFELIGAGSHRSYLINPAETDTIRFEGANTRNCVVKGLAIWQNDSGAVAKAAGHGIHFLTLGSSVLLEELDIQHHLSGLCMDSSVNAGFINSSFIKIRSSFNTNYGFQIWKATSSSFISCFAEGNTRGFDLRGVSYSSFISCAADKNSDQGYHINQNTDTIPSAALTMVSCGCEGSVAETVNIGIYVAQCYGLKIIDPEIWWIQNQGLYLANNVLITAISLEGGRIHHTGKDLASYAIDNRLPQSNTLPRFKISNPFLNNNFIDNINDPNGSMVGFFNNTAYLHSKVSLGIPAPLTIAGGVIAATKSYHILTPQGGAVDDLDTINGGVDGMILVLKGDGTFQIDVKHGTGNIFLSGAADYLLPSTQERITIQYDKTRTEWIEISRF